MAARDLVEQQRAEQLLRDAKLAAELAKQYGPAWERMRTEILQILAVVEKARAAGETVDTRWLLRKGYLDRLEKLVTFQTRTFLDFTARKVQAASVQAALDGQRDAAELVAEAAPGDVPKPLLETSYAVNNLAAGKPLRHLLDSLPGQVGSQAASALLEGVVLGLGPREIARDIRKVATIPLTRALLISRTETLRVYRQAAFDRYRQSSDILTGWVWLAKLDDRTCPVCIALHGTRHELSEEMATHPNCFPAGTLVSGPAPTAATKRWYSGDLVEIETVSGTRLSVTPNHPILTTQGWIAAGLLNEGDDLVNTVAGHGMASIVNPDDQDCPSRIENVFRTLRLAPAMASVSVPSSTVDFHGDGIDGDVHVVRPDSLLRDGHVSALCEHHRHHAFAGTDAELSELAGYGSPFETFDGIGVSSPGVVGERREPEPFLGAALARQELVGFGVVPALYPVLPQDASDDRAGNPEFLRKSILRHAGLVFADQVAKVGRVAFRGHVYNLESDDGWYTANGIVTHNCRCSMAPLTEPWTDPDLPDTRFAPQTGEAWFKSLSPERQRSILGPGKHDLYLDGQLKLADLVQPTTHILWGKGVRERALRDLPVRSV